MLLYEYSLCILHVVCRKYVQKIYKLVHLINIWEGGGWRTITLDWHTDILECDKPERKELPGCFTRKGIVTTIITMAKNTGASKFRKVNVDEYDEENFQDNEDADVGVVGPNENEVSNFLNQCILLNKSKSFFRKLNWKQLNVLMYFLFFQCHWLDVVIVSFSIYIDEWSYFSFGQCTCVKCLKYCITVYHSWNMLISLLQSKESLLENMY